MNTINVLKPFVLSLAPKMGSQVPAEIKFRVGEHQVTDEIANHPYILAGADGHIESAKQAVARATEAQRKADMAKAQADAANLNAKRALERLEATHRTSATNSAQAAAVLDTPLNELNRTGTASSDLDKTIPELKNKELKDQLLDPKSDLNKPVSELNKEDGSEATDETIPADRPQKFGLDKSKRAK